MTAATGGGAALSRFDGIERAVHWATAVLTFVLMGTAAVLYIPSWSAAVGRRDLMRDIHVASGFLLPVPFLLGVASRRGGRLRADVRRLDRWDAADRHWLRTLRHGHGSGPAKFHPGQKLNAAFVAGSIMVMLGTGAMLRWPDPFALSWRTGATFVHDWLALAFTLVIAGHIGFALARPGALRGMVGGAMPAAFAARHHPRWTGDDVVEADLPSARTDRKRAIAALAAGTSIAVLAVAVLPDWGSQGGGGASATVVDAGTGGGGPDPMGALGGGGDDGDRDDVARRFQAAMERNDYESAFRLLDPSSPEAASRDAFFSSRLKSQDDQYLDPGKSEPVARAIEVVSRRAGAGGSDRLLLEVDMSNGKKAWRGVEMRRAAGRWRVRGFRQFQTHPCRDPVAVEEWGCPR